VMGPYRCMSLAPNVVSRPPCHKRKSKTREQLVCRFFSLRGRLRTASQSKCYACVPASVPRHATGVACVTPYGIVSRATTFCPLMRCIMLQVLRSVRRYYAT
jgi:hypothetical protein